MPTQLLAPTALPAPLGPLAPPNSQATPAAAYCLDGEILAVVTNAGVGPIQPCVVQLWLSDDGSNYKLVRTLKAGVGSAETMMLRFRLADYAQQELWTDFYLNFTSNRNDAAPAQGNVTVSAYADGATWSGGGGGGTGTVTSVGLSAFDGITVSGSPVTVAGVLALGTTLSGIIKGTGSGFTIAVPGTDYVTGGQGSILITQVTDLQTTINNLQTEIDGKGTGTVTSITAGTGLSGGTITTSGTIAIATNTANTLAGWNASGAFSGVLVGTGLSLSGGTLSATGTGTGTVTSVAMTVPGIFALAGSPVTTSGTLAVTLATQLANTVWAGPSSGSAAAPTFRALTTADLPTGTGTVTDLSVVTANGFAGTVANHTTTPAITLECTAAGILQSDGTAISAITIGSGLSFDGTTLTATGTGGTVTSVGLTMPTGFSVGSSPVTGTGTIAVTTSLSGLLYGTGSGFSAASLGAGGSFVGGTLAFTGLYPFTWDLALSSDGSVTLATGTDVSNWLVAPAACTLTRWDVVAKTAPTGASAIFDVLKSSDGGATFTSLWASNPTNRPTLAISSKQASGTSFDTATLAAGDILRIDVAQVGSTVPGSNVTLKIQSRMAQ